MILQVVECVLYTNHQIISWLASLLLFFEDFDWLHFLCTGFQDIVLNLFIHFLFVLVCISLQCTT